MITPLQRIEAARSAYQGAEPGTKFHAARLAAFPGRRRSLLGQGDTATRVERYYHEAQSYLEGPLQGTCHFGFTEEGQPFDLQEALHNMEVQLALALHLPAGSKVVDAGCGYGRVATTMAREFGLEVFGVDLMRERLDEAERFTQEQGVADRVHVIEGSFTETGLADNSMQGWYHMETACHADPLESLFAEAIRVLEPGGTFVMFEYSSPPTNSMNPVYRRLADRMIQNTGMASMGRFTHGAFSGLLEAAGFENVTVREVSRNVYPTWRWLFWEALRRNNLSILPKILRGTLTDIPNLAGSLMIYPYRHQLGYNIVTATKPKAAVN